MSIENRKEWRKHFGDLTKIEEEKEKKEWREHFGELTETTETTEKEEGGTSGLDDLEKKGEISKEQKKEDCVEFHRKKWGIRDVLGLVGLEIDEPQKMIERADSARREKFSSLIEDKETMRKRTERKITEIVSFLSIPEELTKSIVEKNKDNVRRLIHLGFSSGLFVFTAIAIENFSNRIIGDLQRKNSMKNIKRIKKETEKMERMPTEKRDENFEEALIALQEQAQEVNDKMIRAIERIDHKSEIARYIDDLMAGKK